MTTGTESLSKGSKACSKNDGMMVAMCRLELMGLADEAAYRRLARGVLQMARSRNMIAGINVPNKKPGEPLLAWAQVLRQELPDVDLCVHYSLKHQRAKGDAVQCFVDFCNKAIALGVASVLLVTGPRGPRTDTVHVLEELARRQVRLEPLRVGVAFNACLPSQEERLVEQARLVRKLKTGVVEDIWLNCGDDLQLLEAGISFVRGTAQSLHVTWNVPMFGSVLLPNPAQLQQMRERPWNGVHFQEAYLSSLAGMERCTRDVLKLYGRAGVQPIVESKVRNTEDVDKLEMLLQSMTELTPAVRDLDAHPPCTLAKSHQKEDDVSAVQASFVSIRRWGPRSRGACMQ